MKHLRAGILVQILVFSLLLLFRASNGTPLESRYFKSSSHLWILANSQLTLYSPEANTASRFVVSGTADSIADVVEDENVLWVSTKSGLYRVDMATTTSERIPFPEKAALGSKVAADFDYVWLAAGKELLRYDKLGGEWLRYSLKDHEIDLSGNCIGLVSDGDHLFWMVGNEVAEFSILDEKWTHYPLQDHNIQHNAIFRNSSEDMLAVDGAILLRYGKASHLWEKISFQAPLSDLWMGDSVLYCLSGNKVFSYDFSTGILNPIEVPTSGQWQACAGQDSTLYLSSQSRILQYNLNTRSSEYLNVPAAIGPKPVDLLLVHATTLIQAYTQSLAVYHPETSVWDDLPVESGMSSQRFLAWNENGFQVMEGSPNATSLKGRIGYEDFPYRLEMAYDTTISQQMVFDSVTTQYQAVADTQVDMTTRSPLWILGDPRVPVDLTLHQDLPGDRYLNASFQHIYKDQLAEKNILYRGEERDHLREIKIGSYPFRIPSARLLPPAQLEGVSLLLESRAKLASRDRKKVRSRLMGGYAVSSSRTDLLYFREDGQYRLRIFRAAADSIGASTGAIPFFIIPGSVEIHIDGEQLDTTDFSIGYKTGFLFFNRQDLMDPTSVIKVSYSVRSLPSGGYEEVEFEPSRHFGRISYADVSVAPAGWIAPRIGFINSDSFSMIHSAAEMEFRPKDVPLFLSFNPEIGLNMLSGARAAGLALRSRIGSKTSFRFNSLYADSGFTTTNRLEQGFGPVDHNVDYQIGYDPIKEVPLSFQQQVSQSERGSEGLIQASAGLRLPNIPFADLIITRNTIQGELDPDTSDTTGGNIGLDSLDRSKNRVKLKFYESSSPFLKRLFHVHRVGYDFAFTEYEADDADAGVQYRGGSVFGRSNLSLTNSIVLVGSGYFRRNNGIQPYQEIYPILQLQTMDMPLGVDLNIRSGWDVKRMAIPDSSTLELSQSISTVLRPGKWVPGLKWFSPRASLSHRIRCGFDRAAPGFGNFLLADAYQERSQETWTPGVGFHLYPSDQVQFQNQNQWAIQKSQTDTTRFSTRNDLKIWLNRSDLWQCRWQMDGLAGEMGRHYGYTRYDRVWKTWLRTKQGLYATYSADTLKTGPKVEVAFTGSPVSVIRRMTNTHSIAFNWSRLAGTWHAKPEILYGLYLRMNILPNLSLINSNSLGFMEEGDSYFQGFSGKLTVQAFF